MQIESIREVFTALAAFLRDPGSITLDWLVRALKAYENAWWDAAGELQAPPATPHSGVVYGCEDGPHEWHVVEQYGASPDDPGIPSYYGSYVCSKCGDDCRYDKGIGECHTKTYSHFDY